MPKRLPSYREHKGSGQAYTSHLGKCIYFGPYGSPESKKKYSQFIAKLTALQTAEPTTIPVGTAPSVVELCMAFFEHVKRRYVKHGAPTSEQGLYRESLSPVISLYGDELAEDFGPVALEVVRQTWLQKGLVRSTINRRVSRIVRCWKWGVAQQVLPVTAWQALQSLEPLFKGQARDNPKIREVSEDRVNACQPFVSRQIWAMIQFQLWTGCRPHEACQVRMADIDRTHEIWEYRPGRFKTEHHANSERIIFIGPHAQRLLMEWNRPNPDELLWQPREARLDWMKAHGSEKVGRGKHQAGHAYTTMVYDRAIERACEKAFGMPPELRRTGKLANPEKRKEAAAWRKLHGWRPNQLRHTAATRLRKTYGIELAQIILGHTSSDMTAVYAAADREKARRAMRESG